MHERAIQSYIHIPPSYISSWRDKLENQIEEELASLGMETNGIPDPYFFYGNKGKLISPLTNRPIEESIEKDSPLGKLEDIAFKKIQKWFSENNSGICLWISPPSEEGKYPSLKIIIGEILAKGEQKILFNRSIKLDNITDKAECVKLAKEISGEASDSPEGLRQNPLFLNKNRLENFLTILGKISQQAKYIENGSDIRIKNNMLVEAGEFLESVQYFQTKDAEFNYVYINQELQQRGILGKFQGSCGGSSTIDSAFNIFSQNSLNLTESYFECPKCHHSIPAGRGITTCPHCGAKKEDYTSCV